MKSQLVRRPVDAQDSAVSEADRLAFTHDGAGMSAGNVNSPLPTGRRLVRQALGIVIKPVTARPAREPDLGGPADACGLSRVRSAWPAARSPRRRR